ncbi:hypothetical protein [Pantoea sp. CCBC3-3-1]|uniref:hypothetical protein n=1 Tax=Pantoea sp. CCBC3-3-1 TaxID=2490851 RepID=UPI0011BDF74C|nr:hypothetical protein [Pantoea sp. CCBC3-3-1]
MSLQRGEASAFMTKMVNDTASYVTLIAAMTFIVILTDKRGYPGAGKVMAVIYGVSAIIMLGYWISNVLDQCRRFKNPRKGFMPGFHASIIAFVTIISCISALVITVVTLTQTLK